MVQKEGYELMLVHTKGPRAVGVSGIRSEVEALGILGKLQLQGHSLLKEVLSCIDIDERGKRIVRAQLTLT